MANQWCSQHWSIIRDEGLNGLLAATRIMQAIVEDEAFMRACGWDPVAGTLADSNRVNEMVIQFSPLCCHLGEAWMQQLYTELRTIRGQGVLN